MAFCAVRVICLFARFADFDDRFFRCGRLCAFCLLRADRLSVICGCVFFCRCFVSFIPCRLCCLWCAQRFRFLRFVLIPLLFCFRNQFGILCFFCHFRFGFIESVLFIHGNASFSHSFLHAAVYKNNVSGIHLNYVKIHVF